METRARFGASLWQNRVPLSPWCDPDEEISRRDTFHRTSLHRDRFLLVSKILFPKFTCSKTVISFAFYFVYFHCVFRVFSSSCRGKLCFSLNIFVYLLLYVFLRNYRIYLSEFFLDSSYTHSGVYPLSISRDLSLSLLGEAT